MLVGGILIEKRAKKRDQITVKAQREHNCNFI